MSFFPQIARWLGRRGQRRPLTSTRRVRSRLTLESLETRDLPSTLISFTVFSPSPPPPPPSTLMVTNLSDTGVSGDGSLRGEIAAANSGDRIVFANNLAGGTITLNPANGSLVLYQDLTIQGPGADKLTISGNNATGVFDIPASLYDPATATVTITGLTIADGNALAGGGIFNQGTLTLDHCTLSGNHAGAYWFSGGGAIDNGGTLTVTNSTLSGNHADGSGYGGGGILNAGTLTVSNSTLSGNTANGSQFGGGGISNDMGAVLTITSSTIAGNVSATGGGIANLNGGTLAVRNTILAGNSATSGTDLAGDLGSQGHNLVGNTAGGGGFAASDLLNVNPQLGPLQYNGGPTQTMALLPGSPAINAGDNTGAPAYDQRGPGFPRIVNGIIDIGAFEVQNVSPTQASSLAVAGFPSVITAGSAGSFTVTALNADGSTDTGYVGTIHFTSSDGQAGLPSDYTFTAGDAGVHTFSATLESAGTQSITASDTNTGGATGGATGISVTPAAASTFRVSAYPPAIVAGEAVSFTVTALDPFGNIATGYGGTVRFTSSDGQAVLPGMYSFTAADQGVHNFTAILKTAGTQSITACDTANTPLCGTEKSILVSPAAGSKFVIKAPSTVQSGMAFSLTVTVEDAYGNLITGYTDTVHFSSTDTRASLPKNYAFTRSDKGDHTFTGLVLRRRGYQTITITDPLISSLSGSVTVDVL
jgi:hypothetical protein